MATPGTREYCHWYANTVYDYCALLFLNPRTLKAKLEDHSVYLLLVVWFSNSTWSQHDAETIHRQRDNNIIEMCSRRPPSTERKTKKGSGQLCVSLQRHVTIFPRLRYVGHFVRTNSRRILLAKSALLP